MLPQLPDFEDEANELAEQRRAALSYVQEAFVEAELDGLASECIAQAALFKAFIELVSTYGEEAAARYAETLSGRVRAGEFTVDRRLQ